MLLESISTKPSFFLTPVVQTGMVGSNGASKRPKTKIKQKSKKHKILTKIIVVLLI